MDIGTVVKRVTGGYMSDSLIFFHKEAIENYPEFWEEIKEKEYEILSFMDKNIIFNLSDKVYQPNADIDFDCGLKYCLNNFKIHSIRRLSDGEVFTLGDRYGDD